MNRFKRFRFCVRLLLIGAVAAAQPALAEDAAPAPLANIVIGSTPGNAISPTFMGLSQEWNSAAKSMGDSRTGVNPLYRQLLSNLTAYGSGPMYLRIGGNSTDATGKPTPGALRPFAELHEALGARFALGVNLAAGDVDLATEQAKAYLSEMPAGSVDAIEIGNEANLYPKHGKKPATYTEEVYCADFEKWRAAIAPLLPKGAGIMGQAWGGKPSDHQFVLSREAGNMTVFSIHYYVGGPTPPPPDDLLLTPAAATKGPARVVEAAATAHSHGVVLRMGELNSIYNGGLRGLSDTFQSALWVVDISFEYAKVGVDGMNWHGVSVSNSGGGPYCPFAFKLTPGTPNTYSALSVHPVYYGLLFFQAASGASAAGSGTHLLPVDLSTKANLKAWATLDGAGVLRLVIINKDENQTGTVSVTAPGKAHASVLRLTASNYKSTFGVSFGGQTFDGSTDGKLQGNPTTETIDAADGVFRLPMPITSAALITFTK